MLQRRLRGKPHTLLALILLLGLGFCWGYFEEKSASSLPVSAEGFTVILDAGHGGFDGGAVGKAGTVEAGLNLAVALQLKAILEKQGVEVLLTRSDEKALASTKREDMRIRGERLGNSRADLALSIHMNSSLDRSVKGPRVYYLAGSEEGERFAGAVLTELCAAAGLFEKAPEAASDYYVLKQNPCPSILVECGFLSHPQEELLLASEAYQKTLAEAIAKGILAYGAAAYRY